MLECALYLADIIGTSPNVNFWVLRVLDAQFVPGSFIIALPASRFLGKVESFFSNGDSNILIVKLDAIKLKKVY